MTLILPRLAFGNCLRNPQMSSLFVAISLAKRCGYCESAHLAFCGILKTDSQTCKNLVDNLDLFGLDARGDCAFLSKVS